MYGHRKRVCIESWLWEKNPLPHRGIELASAACPSDSPPTELHPHPCCYCDCYYLFHSCCVTGEIGWVLKPNDIVMTYFFISFSGRREAVIACWLEHRTRDRKLRVRVPAGAAGECSSPELTLCADSYSVSVPSRVTAVALTRPWSFC